MTFSPNPLWLRTCRARMRTCEVPVVLTIRSKNARIRNVKRKIKFQVNVVRNPNTLRCCPIASHPICLHPAGNVCIRYVLDVKSDTYETCIHGAGVDTLSVIFFVWDGSLMNEWNAVGGGRQVNRSHADCGPKWWLTVELEYTSQNNKQPASCGCIWVVILPPGVSPVTTNIKLTDDNIIG